VVAVPGQTTLPPGAAVQSYPVVEKWRWIWVWMGDPAKADPATIPNRRLMDDPSWIVAPGNGGKPLYIKCNYELNNDNVLDLTHVQFTHANTLGGGSSVGEFPVKTERGPRGIRMTRYLHNVPPTPMFAKYVDAKTVDRWMIADLEAPSHYILDAGIAPPGRGQPGHNRQGGVDFRAIISGTPETPRTMHMFYAQVRNFAHGDAALTDVWVDQFRRVFLEDVAVMEAQQAVNDRYPDAPTIDINSDSPTIAMRKVLAQLIAEEQAAA
jgi:vanillate O-demethylase monooxygenase subunit